MDDPVTIRVASDLVPVVALGALTFDGTRVLEHDAALDQPIGEAERRVRAVPPVERLAVRAMYRQVGIDPTKRRPSSEALLRRVLRGDGLPRINSLVDVCNWCSLELQLPYGLYDGDRLSGGVTLRLGAAGEEYHGIGKDVVHVGGRMVLSDDEGAFGNPTSDSARTRVSTATRRCLVVVFAPRPAGGEVLAQALDVTSARVARFTLARETGRFVV
jgi:DNA/RNA-binding domain of Phe-tRNA-synthetase-like protein